MVSVTLDAAYGHVLRRMKARLLARMRATGDSLASENAWQANSYALFLSARTLTGSQWGEELDHAEGARDGGLAVGSGTLVTLPLTLTRTYGVYTVPA